MALLIVLEAADFFFSLALCPITWTDIDLIFNAFVCALRWELVNPDAKITYLPHPKPADGAEMTFHAL